MVFTTSVVNTHALSHLLDDDLSSAEQCELCDEFIAAHSDDFQFGSPILHVDIQKSFDYLASTPSIIDVSLTVILMPSGEYYNKPPPSFLV
jgi:hypothetical protein